MNNFINLAMQAIVRRRYYLLVVAIIVVVAFVLRAGSQEEFKSDKITLAIEASAPGVFQYKGHTYGYMVDVVRYYARWLGAELDIDIYNSRLEVELAIERGEAVVGLMVKQQRIPDNLHSLNVEYEEGFVILSKRFGKIPSNEALLDTLSNRRISVSESFIFTESYRKLKDSSINRNITFVEEDSLFNRGSAKAMAFGRVDYTVCPELSAHLFSFIYKSFDEVLALPDRLVGTFESCKSNTPFIKSFEQWYSNIYLDSPQHKYNVQLFSDNNFVEKLLYDGFLAIYGEISPYDAIYKSVAQQSGYDWRFLSAIGYIESRFGNHQTSNVGAVGVMQIMPKVAKDYGFDRDSLRQSAYNISVAAHILAQNNKMLNYPVDSMSVDQMSIVLACYNAGYGRISDGKRVAKSVGGDPHRWITLRQGLYMLRDTAYINNNKLVRYGYFYSAPTGRYVAEVMERYNRYLSDTTIVQ